VRPGPGFRLGPAPPTLFGRPLIDQAEHPAAYLPGPFSGNSTKYDPSAGYIREDKTGREQHQHESEGALRIHNLVAAHGSPLVSSLLIAIQDKRFIAPRPDP